jgi:endoglucanase Acf2
LIPYIAKYLKEDIKYQMSNNILRGAADTYFSGKTIARLARIIIIADELQKLKDAADTDTGPSSKSLECLYYGDNTVTKIDIQKSIDAVSKVTLPSTKETDLALKQLKIGVTTWLTSNAEAPYIYDTTWGGMINCGCTYVGKGPNGHCNNTFPNCPALLSVNEDFGNGTFSFRSVPHVLCPVSCVPCTVYVGPSCSVVEELELDLRAFSAKTTTLTLKHSLSL